MRTERTPSRERADNRFGSGFYFGHGSSLASRLCAGLGSVAWSWLCFGAMLVSATVWIDAGRNAFLMMVAAGVSAGVGILLVRRQVRRQQRNTVLTHERLTHERVDNDRTQSRG